MKISRITCFVFLCLLLAGLVSCTSNNGDSKNNNANVNDNENQDIKNETIKYNGLELSLITGADDYGWIVTNYYGNLEKVEIPKEYKGLPIKYVSNYKFNGSYESDKYILNEAINNNISEENIYLEKYNQLNETIYINKEYVLTNYPILTEDETGIYYGNNDNKYVILYKVKDLANINSNTLCIWDKAFENQTVKEIEIPKGIIINLESFDSCPNLEYLKLPCSLMESCDIKTSDDCLITYDSPYINRTNINRINNNKINNIYPGNSKVTANPNVTSNILLSIIVGYEDYGFSAQALGLEANMDIVIPDTYRDIPITTIYSINYNKINNKTLTLGKNVKYVADNALNYFEKIIFTDKVQQIGSVQNDLKKIDGLNCDIINYSMTSSEDAKFLNQCEFKNDYIDKDNKVKAEYYYSNGILVSCAITQIESGIDTINLKDDLKQMLLLNGINCAYGIDVSNISIVLPNNLTNIGYGTFSTKSFKNIYLNNNIKYIGYGAISKEYCTLYNGGYYLGTIDNPYYALIDIDETLEIEKIESFNVHNDCKIIAEGALDKVFGKNIVLPSGLLSLCEITNQLTNIIKQDKGYSSGFKLILPTSCNLYDCKLYIGCEIIYSNELQCGIYKK